MFVHKISVKKGFLVACVKKREVFVVAACTRWLLTRKPY